ncbi:MAG: hypothetical protein AAGB01_05415 [Cyanobacteria bacterium P01_F01_bin.42]
MAKSTEIDGQLLTYDKSLPQGRARKLIHVNGVMSPAAKQARDLEALVWMTLESPMDAIAIHNSTQGFQSDIVECLLGKAELYSLWSGKNVDAAIQRVRGYADLIRPLIEQKLSTKCDMIQAVKQGDAQAIAPRFGIDFSLLQRLPNRAMDLGEISSYWYGNYPAGAPRATLRLAHEIIQSLNRGTEVFVIAHSQGTIIAAIALHIVAQFFNEAPDWSRALRLIGYGPVIMFEDLPSDMRSQTVLIQHREDLVAESFSNVRNVDLWSDIQAQLQKVLENVSSLTQLIQNDSRHSSSNYLGLSGESSAQRSAQILQQLLISSWNTPILQSLTGTRLILENS